LLRGFGIELRRFPIRDLEITLNELIARERIDVVIDVGANIGQFAEGMRAVGYPGRIVSFEPMKTPFEELRRRTVGDPRWEVRNLAVGDTQGELTINVAANSWSSSLLPMESRHVESAPESATIGQEKVSVVRLDSQIGFESGALLLKIDTQGYESQVLDGLGNLSDQIKVLSVEMSFVELYSGQMLFHDLLTKIEGMGFQLWWLQPEFVDLQSRQMLQVNGVFVRSV
jgi:FkbM family methyltransferase